MAFEQCPYCKQFTAETNHYTRELICYSKECIRFNDTEKKVEKFNDTKKKVEKFNDTEKKVEKLEADLAEAKKFGLEQYNLYHKIRAELAKINIGGCDAHTDFSSSEPWCPVCLEKELAEARGKEADYKISVCYFPSTSDAELTWQRISDGESCAITVRVTPKQGDQLAKIISPCVHHSATKMISEIEAIGKERDRLNAELAECQRVSEERNKGLCQYADTVDEYIDKVGALEKELAECQRVSEERNKGLCQYAELDDYRYRKVVTLEAELAEAVETLRWYADNLGEKARIVLTKIKKGGE